MEGRAVRPPNSKLTIQNGKLQTNRNATNSTFREAGHNASWGVATTGGAKNGETEIADCPKAPPSRYLWQYLLGRNRQQWAQAGTGGYGPAQAFTRGHRPAQVGSGRHFFGPGRGGA